MPGKGKGKSFQRREKPPAEAAGAFLLPTARMGTTGEPDPPACSGATGRCR